MNYAYLFSTFVCDMKRILNSSILAFASCLLMSSCQKLFSNHSGCHSTVPDYTQNISVGNWESKVDFWVGAGKEYMDSAYHLGLVQQKPDKAQWVKWWQYYHLDTAGTSIAPMNIVTWVLYLKKDRADSSIDLRTMSGSSVYYVRDGKLMVCIFKKEKGDEILYPLINTSVRNIPVLDFYKTALLFRDNPTDNINALVISFDNFNRDEWKAIKRRSGGSLDRELEVLMASKAEMTRK